MNRKTIAWSLLALSVSAGGAAFAQEKVDSTENKFSAHPIGDEDVMMKRTLWRRVDLKEKQNVSLFSKNNEITRYLIEAAKAGLIDAYTNDSCTVKVTSADMHKKLLIPNQTAGLSAEEIAAGFGTPATKADDGWGAKPAEQTKQAVTKEDDGWGTTKKDPKTEVAVEDDGWGAPKKKSKKGSKNAVAKKEEPVVVEAPKVDSTAFATQVAVTEEEFFPDQLSVLEIKEDWTFDKKRSRLYSDIQTLSIILPADQTASGLELPVASFRYKDVERLFRSDPKKYIWYNTHNTAQNKNLADAFDLRLFYGRITKFSNANDRAFLDIYGGDREALIKSLNYEQELMELEHGLWEY